MTTLAVGTVIPPLRIPQVSGEKMKTLALLLRDPNPIHWDPSAVQRLGLGDRVINQGPASVGYILTMLTCWAGQPSAIRRFSCRLHENVRAGDAVTARGTISSLHRGPDGLVAVCDVSLERDDSMLLISGTAEIVRRDGRRQ